MTKTYFCKQCGKENKWKLSTTNTYCNNVCQMEYQRQENIDNWQTNGYTWTYKTPLWVRWFLQQRDGCGCKICGITDWNAQPITLECDHIDGDASNCVPENLRLICPNCHSQTPTYKAKNIGNGRHVRKTRYQEGKSF